MLFHEIHERLGHLIDPLEGVDKVCQVHGVLDSLHQEMGGVHGQVAEGIVTLQKEVFNDPVLVRVRLTIISWNIDGEGLGVGRW